MEEKKLEAMYRLLDATSDKIMAHENYFKTMEAEFNKIHSKMATMKLINNLLVGAISETSIDFKDNFKFAIEQELSSGHSLPADFEIVARHSVAAVYGQSPPNTDPKPFRLLHGGKDLKNV